LPDQGFENQPAIEGQPWQQVEQGQDQIQATQFRHHRAEQWGEVAGTVAAAHQHGRQDEADQGARRSDHQRSQGGGALPLDAGDSAQQEQGDAAHLHPLAQGHQGMAQFMEQDRDEEQQSRRQAHGPEQRFSRAAGELLAVLLLEGHGGQSQDQKPARVDP
jgi:hypothetical protein